MTSGLLRLFAVVLFLAWVGPHVAHAQSTAASAQSGDETQANEESGQSEREQGDVDSTSPSAEPTQDEIPWSEAEEDYSSQVPSVPAFLDTTDLRLQDEREPPTESQVQALREMESEVSRFSNTAEAYQSVVNSMLRREYTRQRWSRDRWYDEQVVEEDRLQNDARDQAIRLFERFVARYPDDSDYTPDAMFRLGELYFERSAVQFQEQYDAANEAAERGEQLAVPDFPDFMPTVEIYQRLAAHFPEYRRVDGAYYLIGYCLNEMGRPDEARMAWLNLVCANQYRYDPMAFVSASPPAEEEQDDAAQYPAISLDAPGTLEAPRAESAANPYASCQPVSEDARFLSETWFRVGEYHFDDYRDSQALDLAIHAYSQILSDSDDRNYNLALYKIAWAYYRASRYPEAIRYFTMLVDWSDRERARTGRAGSELRPEAIQYLGISFAYDDWNENQVPDAYEGQPTSLQRVQNPALLPQDQPWTAEVYFQLGQVYFDEAKYPEAVEVWQLALQRWPYHHRAAEITNMIARAYQMHNQREEHFEALAELARFGPGACEIDPNCWYSNQIDHPSEQREAEEMAEGALIRTALRQHQEAQSTRRECVRNSDLELCNEAQRLYRAAAIAYRQYLLAYPNDPQAYELRYNLADALFWSEDYENAALEYASVRDSNLDDTHLGESARRVVESVKRINEQLVGSGRLQVRSAAPDAQGDPLQIAPMSMPEPVQRIAQAREMYLARVSDADDLEDVREAYDFNNALLLYWYGYWDYAQDRFQRIFDERCSGRFADETGQTSWENLRNMAIALGNNDRVEELARELQDRRCTFQASSIDCSDEANSRHPDCRTVDCEDPINRDAPLCRAMGDLNSIRYRRALDIFQQACGTLDVGNCEPLNEDRRRLYERSATMLVEAVNRNPGDTQAPVALEYAATALERTSRFESAAGLYERIVEEVGPRSSEDVAEQARLDAILANAYFRLAYNSNRFFEFDRAVENYRILADSSRFQSTEDEKIRQYREDSLINAAVILENLQRYDPAASYYQRAAETTSDEETRRRAYYRIAEMRYTRGDWAETIRQMRSFLDNPVSQGSGELRVQARWRIAQAFRQFRREREYRNALRNVVSEFESSGEDPGSLAAEYAAHARFMLVDAGMAEYERIEIDAERPTTMEAYVGSITSQIDDASQQANARSEAYSEVPSYRRPAWTIAALVQQGRVYEVLVRAILNTPFVMPGDMQRQLRAVDPMDRDLIQIEVEDRIRAVLDDRVRPIECLAIARYALASRAARQASLDDEFTQTSTDRLQAYGEERIAECIAEVQQTDPSMGAYQNGEFTRAPRGRTVHLESGAPPSILGGIR